MLLFMMVFIFTVAYYRKHFNIKNYNNLKKVESIFLKIERIEKFKLSSSMEIIKKLNPTLWSELVSNLYYKEKEIDLLLCKYHVYRIDYDKKYAEIEKAYFKMYIDIMRKNAFKK